MLVAAERVEFAGDLLPVAGNVLVKLPPYPAYRYGDRLALIRRLDTPREAERPGQLDYRLYLERKRIFSLMQPESSRRVAVNAGSPVLRALLDARDTARQRLLRMLPEPQSSLAIGILLGLQSSIPRSGLWYTRRSEPADRSNPMSRFSLQRIIAWAFGALLAAQMFVIGVLAAVALLRRRRMPPASFPHARQPITGVDGTDIRLFTYGQDLYGAMLAAIDTAEESIFLETFIWKGDEVGETFKQRLARKASEGVDVYVIFDSFANLVVPRRFKRFPPEIHTIEYRTLERVWYAFDPRRYARDHRKLLVVDNKIGFVGGFNIGKLYATQWRDTHLRLQGSAALELAHAFADFWNNNRHGRRPIDGLPPRPWPGRIRVHRNDPGRLVFPIRGAYIDAFDRARHNIYLTNAYFIPDRLVLDALIAAAHRGVDVRVLLPWQSNHITADWLARGFFDDCLSNGVRIFGYRNAMIHAKTATVDAIWSTVGTANLDRLSLAGNYEINVEVIDPGFAATMEAVFMADLSNAFELTLESWRRRTFMHRASELILSPLRPLL